MEFNTKNIGEALWGVKGKYGFYLFNYDKPVDVPQ
jgi:hypothetical protein